MRSLEKNVLRNFRYLLNSLVPWFFTFIFMGNSFLIMGKDSCSWRIYIKLTGVFSWITGHKHAKFLIIIQKICSRKCFFTYAIFPQREFKYSFRWKQIQNNFLLESFHWSTKMCFYVLPHGKDFMQGKLYGEVKNEWKVVIT